MLMDDWRTDAACKGLDPELFFPRRGDDSDAPKAVCESCPVRIPCLEHALAAPEFFGVHGGESERGRRRLRKERRKAA